jgi:hypothetical protein
MDNIVAFGLPANERPLNLTGREYRVKKIRSLYAD